MRDGTVARLRTVTPQLAAVAAFIAFAALYRVGPAALPRAAAAPWACT